MELSLVRYIKNSRNTETLIAGEFMFRKNKSRDEKIYWKCRKSGCNAKITTHDGKVVGYFLKHNHVDNNHDEILRLEGLHSRNNQPQVTQVENVIHQEIITPEESFVDYSFAVESIVTPTSGGSIVIDTQRRVDEINGIKDPSGDHSTSETTVAIATIEDPEAEADAATSSLTIMFKEFSESQKKIEQLVTNLVSPGESDDIQSENIRLKEQLDETIRKCKTELEAKELAIQEQKSRAETVEKEMQARLAVERSIKEKLADENAELKLIVEHYEKKIKENVQRDFLFQ